jgi:hypothetical protein
MTALATDVFFRVGPGVVIPSNFVVPRYLDDRKLRIAIARFDDRLYAFDDLCTCADEGCPPSAYLTRFQIVSAVPPTLAPGLVHFSSSPVKEVTGRF